MAIDRQGLRVFAFAGLVMVVTGCTRHERIAPVDYAYEIPRSTSLRINTIDHHVIDAQRVTVRDSLLIVHDLRGYNPHATSVRSTPFAVPIDSVASVERSVSRRNATALIVLGVVAGLFAFVAWAAGQLGATS